MVKTLRQDAYHRSFVAMRNALRSIIFHEGECYRSEDPNGSVPCECSICVARAALEGEEDWRFVGYSPDRVRSMPRELAMVEAWKHYFKRSSGSADGSSAPADKILAQILGVDADTVSERDWYVATTVVQWLATNVGQCVLQDAGYVLKIDAPPSPAARPEQEKSAKDLRTMRLDALTRAEAIQIAREAAASAGSSVRQPDEWVIDAIQRASKDRLPAPEENK